VIDAAIAFSMMRITSVSAGNILEPPRQRMRCPICGVAGTLDSLRRDLGIESATPNSLAVGERSCPNADCGALIIVVYARHRPEELIAAWPAERIDFDSSDLPPEVKEPLEEAIDCHGGGNYKAAALMVRRTLEAVCADKDATGDALFERIEALSQVVVLPAGMTEALHDVRLLGNDAAHVEARTYLEVGQQEVSAALEVTKLILSATYQSEKALSALRALRPDPSR
jgi:hypothetical protein